MASPSPPAHEDDAGAVVCCMCGDHGLPRELFRCRSCRVRLQHRYCSNLYPRAAAYRRCNWCLREPAESGGGAGLADGASNKPTEMKRRATPSSVSDEERRQRHEGCSRRPPPPAGLAQPVKKKHKTGADDEKMPPPASPGAVKGGGGTSDGKELMRALKTRVRVKVRRYKLLAEVISC